MPEVGLALYTKQLIIPITELAFNREEVENMKNRKINSSGQLRVGEHCWLTNAGVVLVTEARTPGMSGGALSSLRLLR